jgi:acetyltransferase-like isoleucine patch superfamily enzyme
MLQRAEREPVRSARLVTVASLRWVIRHRALTPWYLTRYWRFFAFKLRNRHVITTGFVFLDRGVEIDARKGYGRLVLGRFVHLGAGTALRCHEGTLSVGDKSVLARGVSINCFLDVEIGACALIADNVYICDFDHNIADPGVPIKDQGIAKSRVRIGRDVWIGTKVTVTRGVRIGDGAVIGANAVVTRDLPAYSVSAGVPAHVIKDRRGEP